MFRRIIRKWRNPQPRCLEQDLAQLWGQAKSLRLPKSEAKEHRILYGPSFSIFEPAYAHDSLLSLALYLRGLDLVPVYCDGIMERACNVYGGVWSAKSFEKNCTSCQRRSVSLWGMTPLTPLKLSTFLSRDDYKEVDDIINGLTIQEVLHFTKEGIHFGLYAQDIALNNETVASPGKLEDINICKTHLRNLLRLDKAYSGVLDTIKPDRVVTNDTYYGMWRVLQEHSMRCGIPTYSHWPAQKEAVAYQCNGSSMVRDFSSSWPAFSSRTLSQEDEQLAQELIERQQSGKDNILNTSILGDGQVAPVSLERFISKSSRVALLCTNVIWDLAALNKSIVFQGMIEWVVATIKWFGEHQEYKLIIKPHPAETMRGIPVTKHQVAEEVLRALSGKIPDNILLLSPASSVTLYDIIPHIHLGLVFTSSVGPEMAVRGVPTITVADSPYRNKGYTVDPIQPAEYFTYIEEIFEGKIFVDSERQIDLAKKYFIFLYQHVYLNVRLIQSSWDNGVKLLVKSGRDLLPGREPKFDYVVDAIVSGQPIYREDDWP